MHTDHAGTAGRTRGAATLSMRDARRRFTFRSTIHFDELDAMGILHNARYAVHVERAVIAFQHSFAGKWDREVDRNPDQFQAVREFQIEFLAPVAELGPLDIAIWAERIGTSSCVHGYVVTSASGAVCHARGRRAIVKIDPETMRPVPWTEGFRRAHDALLAA